MPYCKTPAKLNLFLEVVAKRDDGYHDLESLFLAVDLCDALRAEPAPAGRIELVVEPPLLAAGEDNLVVKAARLLARECGIDKGVRFHLNKNIPMGGGLGGGSSDAAAALTLTNQLWGTKLGRGDLAALGARLGSDVPFFLHGGFCLCRGRGELVEPLSAFPETVALGVVLSNVHSDTAAAYRQLRLPDHNERRRSDGFLAALAAGDLEALRNAAFNRFEETVFAALPDLGRLRDGIAAVAGVEPRLSGSGSGLWFFGDAEMVRRTVGGNPKVRELAERLETRILAVRPYPAAENI